MTLTVKIGEAKARFSELVAKAEAGEDIIIARRAAIEAMLRERDDGTRKKVTLEEVLAWRHEGHRY